MRLALAGSGDFELSDSYKKFEVSIDLWAEISKEKRDKHYQRFMRKLPLLDPRTVISTDDSQAFTGPGHNGGKKPNQRKRRKSTKTTIKTKSKLFKDNHFYLCLLLFVVTVLAPL